MKSILQLHGGLFARRPRMLPHCRPSLCTFWVPVLDERRFTLNNMCDAYRTIRADAARGELVVDIAASNA
jgi:hypothetical protein